MSIASDAGRVCRPYIILEDGKVKLTNEDFRNLTLGACTFEGFVREG